MRKFAIQILCLVTISSFAQKQKPLEDKRFAGLDTAFARVLKEWHAAGFAVAVVEKDKIVYSKGFGYRDYENKIPVTPNTLFAIGSCSKAFTSSLLGILRQEGKVDFDKPVRNYLPELKFYNDDMNEHITLRDMICHRTGLPRHDASWYYFLTTSRDSLVGRIQYQEPSAGVREKWQYNNFMYMAQGVVVEKLSDKSWEENIRERIFQPLDMNNSTTDFNEWIHSKDAAIGYNVKKDSIIHKTDYYDIGAMGPAGSINSSVNDMSNWVITWINGGKFKEKQIIPPDYTSEAISSQMVITGLLPTKENPDIYLSNYGFGWVLNSYRGHYRVMHDGGINGFTANTSFFPSDSIGIIVLCNQESSYVPPIVRNIIADKMFGLKYFDWETDLKRSSEKTMVKTKNAGVSAQNMNTKTSHELKDYEGAYTNKGYGDFEIVLQHDSLFAFAAKYSFWLRHYHYDVFESFEKDPKEGIDTTDDGNPHFQFNINDAGDIETVSVQLEPALKPIVFTRTIKAKEISKDTLQKFTGEYEISGVTMKIYTKNSNTLYMFVPGQPEYELIPLGDNKFSIKNLNNYSVQFNLNDKGDVKELFSIQPNGTFKAIKKK